MLAFLGVGIAVHGSLAFYTDTIRAYWKQADPGACEAHRRMMPPRFINTGGQYLRIDPRYPYRTEDRELVEEWKFFKKIAAGALVFIWLLLLICTIRFG